MAGRLSGKRILVIEDEYFIASDLARALRKEDAVVVGPAGALGKGMTLLDGEPLDAAVLDVNLESDHSYPIADKLAERSVPYMFLTGYDGWALPEAYRNAPRVAKPFAVHTVLACVGELVGTELQP